MATSEKCSHGKKRAAEEEIVNTEEPSPKRGFLGRTFERAVSAFIASSAAIAVDAMETVSAQPPVQAPAPQQALPPPLPEMAPVPTNPVEHAKRLATYIDFNAAKRAAEREEAEIKDPSRKLKFNVKIGPQDDDWKTTRQRFLDLLKSVKPIDIFNDEFEKTQILYIMPTLTNEIILGIQKEHTESYKPLFSPEGRFHNIPDNLATKLTMMHFGLPIEPVTMNNLFNCGKIDKEGKNIDVSDEEDLPVPGPTYERVIYGEKPLEFLDKYSDGRSYGYPKLRTAKRRNLTQPEVQQEVVNDGPVPKTLEAGRHIRGNHHRFVGTQRGGAGSPQDLAPSKSRSRSRSRSQYRKYPKYIYGYHGKSDFNHRDYDHGANSIQGEFLTLALGLLEYDFLENDAGHFSAPFMVDIFTKGIDNKPDSHKITPSNLGSQFSEHILPVLKAAGNNEAPVFVRTLMSPAPHQELEPGKDDKDIIRLKSVDRDSEAGLGAITSYWKIPRNLFSKEPFGEKASKKDWSQQYGINQCQPGFLRAMKIVLGRHHRGLHDFKKRLFLSHEGPSLDAVFAWNLGFGGVEVTPELWKHVCGQAKNVEDSSLLDSSSVPDVFELYVYTQDFPTATEGLHLVGAEQAVTASMTDPRDILRSIESMSKDHFKDEKVPERIRVWSSIAARIKAGSLGKSILLEDKSVALKALRHALDHDPDRDSEARCLWWHPEFSTFDVENPKNKNAVKWDTQAGCKLADFRKSTKDLSADGKALKSFCLSNGQNGGGRKLIVTRDTTEEEWRLHTYEWLHDKQLYIYEIEDIPFVLDRTSLFGIPDPILTSENARTKAKPKQTNAPDVSFGTETTAPRLNKERVVAAAAGKANAKPFATWVEGEHSMDGLQRRSYSKDQSVIEPGKLPAAPLFGASLELQLGAGTSMPTVYVQHLTPTDIRHLKEENTILRNQVLERMFYCTICDTSFEHWKKDEIQEHIKEHKTQLKEAGNCPICNDERWCLMSTYEKRGHFEMHQRHNEGKVIQHFYRGQQCPICNEDLSKLKAAEVISHCLEHTPGQVRFCHRCRLDLHECDPKELHHHRHKCLLAENQIEERIVDGQVEKRFRRREFFDKCGVETTRPSEDEEQNKPPHICSHVPEPHDTFCHICGFDLTSRAQDKGAVAKHAMICKESPGGWDYMWCAICGEEAHHHGKTCPNLDVAQTGNRKTKEINAENARLKAENAALKNCQKQPQGRPGPGGTILCPLQRANGDTCNHPLDISTDCFDLTTHYKHQFSAHDRAPLAKKVATVTGDYARLRAKVVEAIPGRASNTAFISQRDDLLVASETAPLEDLPECNPLSAWLPPQNASKLADPRQNPGPAQAPSQFVQPPQQNVQALQHDPEIEKKRKAREWEANQRMLATERAKIMERANQNMQNHLFHDGSEEPDGAITRSSAATKKAGIAALLAARGRVPYDARKYKDLKDESESEEKEDSDMGVIEQPPTPKRGRAAKVISAIATPAQAAPATGGKRKQYEDPEPVAEPPAKKGKRSVGATSAKKTLKKIEEALEPEIPRRTGRPRTKAPNEGEEVVSAKGAKTPLKKATKTPAKK